MIVQSSTQTESRGGLKSAPPVRHLGSGPDIPYRPDGPGSSAHGRVRNHDEDPGAPESGDGESVAGGPQPRVRTPPAGSGLPAHPVASLVP